MESPVYGEHIGGSPIYVNYCIHNWVTTLKLNTCNSPSDKAHFSPPINCYTNELTIHVYTITNDSLVCFSWHCLLWPVWHAWVLEWSSNGSGVNRQVSTLLEITTILARKLGHQIGCCLWYLELKWVSGETFWQINFNMWFPTTFMSPHHSQPIPLYAHLWECCRNYLKWQTIQLAVLCRVCQLKDIV